MFRQPLLARPGTSATTATVLPTVVMCGCPVMTPMGWCFVWRAVLQPLPSFPRTVTPEAVAPYLSRFVNLN
ncbi:MAG: hypothetical protein HYZ53_05985 [Planctomycetes bacterium]|nr:hypothetical protein [Planctomycetota bacterium]